MGRQGQRLEDPAAAITTREVACFQCTHGIGRPLASLGVEQGQEEGAAQRGRS